MKPPKGTFPHVVTTPREVNGSYHHQCAEQRPRTLWSTCGPCCRCDGSHSTASARYRSGNPRRPPYIDQRFSECIDQHVIVIGCRRDAQPLCAARDGRLIDRLDADAVLGEQKIARFLALLRITHHHRHNARLVRHHRQAGGIEHGLHPRGAVLMALALPLRSLEVRIAAMAAARTAGGNAVVKMNPGA
jgi:hypothetical protein